MEVIYYTRKQCPLCEDGKEVLLLLQTDYPFTIVERDIEADDGLTEKFGLMIPVVEIHGEIIQYGMIDYFTIEEALQARFD